MLSEETQGNFMTRRSIILWKTEDPTSYVNFLSDWIACMLGGKNHKRRHNCWKSPKSMFLKINVHEASEEKI